MQESIPTGISFKKDLISKIDFERGDVPRSKYIQRILEKYYLIQGSQKEEKTIKFDSSDSTTAAKQKEGSDESLAIT
jgi:hypothetical protein